MRIRPISLFLIPALISALSSCEEVIEIDLNSTNPVLVAEGYMDLDSVCTLRLTYTTDYFQQERAEPAEDALVRLSDQSGASEFLSHMGSGIYKGHTIRGTEYSEYTLSIETDEQFNSGFSTLMPAAILDTVRIENFPFGNTPPGPDFPGLLTISFHNNPGIEEQYMLRLTWNGESLEDNFALASDAFSPSSETIEFSTVIFPSEEGDTLSMEVYSIDRATYRYYSQINEAIGGGMAMSSTPYNPASNLGEDILGYFMARSRIDTILVVQ